MDEGSIGLILIILGIAMLISEAASPGFFIAIPATVILILGIVGVIAPDVFFTWVSPVIAVVVGIPMTVVTILLYQKLAPPEKPTTTVGTSLVGRTGTVSKIIKPKEISGKVTVEQQKWSATAKEIIPVGEEVVIVGSKGVHVTVERINKEE
ncbi:MAG: NfeD family protein [Thermoplasmata archaeon]|nr:NfeD family protein [Thermoplasmata archaeon]